MRELFCEQFKVARIYLRVSTGEQDLQRQEHIVTDAKKAGYYVAAIYREKASGARADRPVLLRMIAEMQEGDTLIAERIDRITRLPLPEAETLISSIRAKGVKLAIPGIIDLSALASSSDNITNIVLKGVQDMLLRIALQSARDNYETMRERQRQGIERARRERKYAGRKADHTMHERIIMLRSNGYSITDTAKIAGCSLSQVKFIMKKQREKETSSLKNEVSFS